MRRALVLNATYEPLCVVPGRRAACSCSATRPTCSTTTGEALHSRAADAAGAVVIRLRYFVKVPFQRRPPLNRRACSPATTTAASTAAAAAESIDHVVPRSRGGEHIWENVVAACRPCNVRKRDRTAARDRDAAAPPTAPRPASMTWVVVAVGTVPEHWEPYLHPAALSASRGGLRSRQAERA